MKKNILYGLSLFTLILMAITILFLFFVAVYPFDLIDITKQTKLKTEYHIGDEIDKTLEINKKTDSPAYMTLELLNTDIIPLATIKTYAGSGRRTYTIAETIPSTSHVGMHMLRLTACTEILFRDVCKSFISDQFNVLPKQSILEQIASQSAKLKVK